MSGGEWIFTFGSGQYHPDGRHLFGWYVRVPAATLAEAKAEMVRLFGQKWSGHYTSAADAGVEEHGLRELPLPAEPVPGMAQAADLDITAPLRVPPDHELIHPGRPVTVRLTSGKEVTGIVVLDGRLYSDYNELAAVLQVRVDIPRSDIEYCEVDA